MTPSESVTDESDLGIPWGDGTFRDPGADSGARESRNGPKNKEEVGEEKSRANLFFAHFFFCPFRLSLAPLSAPGSPRMGERELSLKIFTGYPKGTEMQFMVTFYWKQLTLHGPP